jgi:hypothetical protein
VSVANHVSRPGTFEGLREFLLDYAGHRVVVEVDAHKAISGVPALYARGILWPLTPEDHERTLQMLDEQAGFGDRDHTEELADRIGHYADFDLLDGYGGTTASVMVWDGNVQDVVIGRIGWVEEHRGQEIVVGRDYASFCIDVMRWDCDRLDEDGTPDELPSQVLSIRVEHWVEQPLERALRAFAIS